MLPNNEIEPRILPLVQALNGTGLVHTFSSCEGHFDSIDRFYNRHHADVRFDPADGLSDYDIERFISFIITRFTRLHSFSPVTLTAHKLYAPVNPDEEKEIDFVYVVELRPFDQGTSPEEKRYNIDNAILDASEVVASYSLKS